jgi:hypothetical protein
MKKSERTKNPIPPGSAMNASLRQMRHNLFQINVLAVTEGVSHRAMSL